MSGIDENVKILKYCPMCRNMYNKPISYWILSVGGIELFYLDVRKLEKKCNLLDEIMNTHLVGIHSNFGMMKYSIYDIASYIQRIDGITCNNQHSAPSEVYSNIRRIALKAFRQDGIRWE